MFYFDSDCINLKTFWGYEKEYLDDKQEGIEDSLLLKNKGERRILTGFLFPSSYLKSMS